MNKFIPLEAGLLTGFNEKVYALTRRIPRGMVGTYAGIARALGAPRAARAVGNALNKNLYPAGVRGGAKMIPCHRVVRSDGTVGGYASGTAKKISWLRKEGIEIKNGKVDIGRFGYSF